MAVERVAIAVAEARVAVKAGDARVAAAMAVARVFREGKRILERIGQAPSSYQGLCTFRGLLSDVCVRDEIEACAATSGRTGTDERRCARPQASARRHLLPSALEPKGSSPFRSPSLSPSPLAGMVGGGMATTAGWAVAGALRFAT